MSDPRSEHQPPCSCTSTPAPDEVWTEKGEQPPPTEDRVRFINEDPKCPRHGEGTEYRHRRDEYARDLAKRFGLLTDPITEAIENQQGVGHLGDDSGSSGGSDV